MSAFESHNGGGGTKRKAVNLLFSEEDLIFFASLPRDDKPFLNMKYVLCSISTSQSDR